MARNQSHTVIEELDDSDAFQFDDTLERILIAQKRDGYKFLEVVFAFLERHSSFFKQPDASKQLARLLRDVKRPASTISNGVAKGPAEKAKSSAGPAPVCPEHRPFRHEGVSFKLLLKKEVCLSANSPLHCALEVHRHALSLGGLYPLKACCCGSIRPYILALRSCN